MLGVFLIWRGPSIGMLIHRASGNRLSLICSFTVSIEDWFSSRVGPGVSVKVDVSRCRSGIVACSHNW